ncbi:MAG TPA: lysine--tRNA ligase [Chloroflexota bacterium]|jgi:lysyl-tRNA synthetase class 2
MAQPLPGDDPRAARLAKLDRLRAAGVEPYPYAYGRTHLAADLHAHYDELEGQEVAVAGRLVGAKRVMGKLGFAHLQDVSGRIQLYLRVDVSAEAFELFKEYLDTGDFVGARGTLMRTRTGEDSVEVRELTLLSKSLQPLPEKWHGLTDVEKRYRQRYVDLIVNQDVQEVFAVRSRALQAIRGFLVARGYQEVETPVLQPIPGGGSARPFATYYNALDRTLYLRIALELYLKRCVIGGMERVFEIGRNFRNEGLSTKHNPEFTMLELYEAYADYHDVMALVEAMLPAVAQEVLGTTRLSYGEHAIELAPPWPRVPLREAIRERTGVDYAALPDDAALRAAARAAGLRPEPTWTRAKVIDELLSVFVEPHLIQPTFLVDYPVELSPLAKRKRDDPATVERFECFIGGMEIGNAFSELNDPLDQRARFEAQVRARQQGDEEAQPMDEDFLEALEYGMPPTGGLGIGIDRLVMLLANRQSIREVILFPQLRTIES